MQIFYQHDKLSFECQNVKTESTSSSANNCKVGVSYGGTHFYFYFGNDHMVYIGPTDTWHLKTRLCLKQQSMPQFYEPTKPRTQQLVHAYIEGLFGSAVDS
jgi:hypothetical protein